MLSFFFRKLHFLNLLKENNGEENIEEDAMQKLTDNFEESVNTFKQLLGNSDDIVIHEFDIGRKYINKAAIIYIDGLVDNHLINNNIIKPLMYYLDSKEVVKYESIENFTATSLSMGQVEASNNFNELIEKCLNGDSILLINGFDKGLMISTKKWEKRSVEEPQTEVTVRGPREGFTETIRTNTSLLRRKIKNTSLTFESTKLGKRTNTHIEIVYLKDLVNPKLVKEVRERLKRIRIDGILDSGYVEEFIEDAPLSIFPTVGHSERPDVVASKLLEGRIAIMVDGSPIVLTVPMFFTESFQSAEDYYSRPYYSSFIRIFRFVAFFISVLAPAAYVTLTSFHQEMIPTPLLITMAVAHEGIPFPAVLESLLMIITFEIIKEAGIRLPRPIGQTISIVGALVIGEAAVSAGLIGAPMVIVVSLTAISSFIVPTQNDAGTLLRIIFILLAGFMGAYGVIIGLLALLLHLSSLRSFGTPYLSPLAPFNSKDLKDTFIREPLWDQITRPKDINQQDKEHLSHNQMPKPPSNDNE